MSDRIAVTGHKLLNEWNHERGEESGWTGRCICGRWTESGSTRAVVRFEYRQHLRRERDAETVLRHRLVSQ